MLYTKLLAAVLFLIAMILIPIQSIQAATVVADQAGAAACAGKNCVLACNASLRICSLFPSGKVPAGYRRVKHIPFGYRRVRQSVCDKLVCPDRSTTCRRWTPTGQNTKQ
jgi:hypothetical protein